MSGSFVQFTRLQTWHLTVNPSTQFDRIDQSLHSRLKWSGPISSMFDYFRFFQAVVTQDCCRGSRVLQSRYQMDFIAFQLITMVLETFIR